MFQDWTNNNGLIHLPTRGALFTLSNGRKGGAHTEKRFDRAICNQAWLSFCNSSSCSTLLRTKSGHYPLLLDFNFSNTIFVTQFDDTSS
jgi:hypothetical protein